MEMLILLLCFQSNFGPIEERQPCYRFLALSLVDKSVRETFERGDDSSSKNFLYFGFSEKFVGSVSTTMDSPPSLDPDIDSLP